MEKRDIKIGAWLQEGFNLYKSNFLLLIVISFLGLLLGKFTMGILMGPMAAGIILIVLGLLDNNDPKPEIGDVFKGFAFFLDSFLLVIACMVAFFVAVVLFALVFNPIVMSILMIILAVAFNLFFVLSLCLIADKKMDFWPAIKAVAAALKSDFLPLMCIMFVAILVSVIGALACGVGILVTMPMYWCVMALVYRDMIRNKVAVA